MDSAGNVYLGGYFDGSGNPTTPALTKIGVKDAFAFKLDSSGNTTWSKNFGGSGAYAYGSSVAVNSSGNVYLGGYFENADLTTPALTKLGLLDAFAIKLDSSGNTTWAKNFGGIGAMTQGGSIAVDSAGNVYLGGYFRFAHLDTPALNKLGEIDAFTFKLDSSGNTTWAKNFGGIGAMTQGGSIAVDSAGNVYLGGYFDSASLTTPSLPIIGIVDAFAIKLDSFGTPTWWQNYGGSGAYAYGKSVAVDGAGNVYLGGHFEVANLATPALTMIGNTDAFAIKLGSSGNPTWSQNYGGSGARAYGQGIAVDSTGNVYLGGYFQQASLTTPALPLIADQHGFVLKQAIPVDGACGSAHTTTPLVTSAPSTNLCTSGTASSVTASNSAYNWVCAGSGGGNPSGTCSASRGYTVTPSAGSNGNISPNTAQVVAYNATPAFTAAPSIFYAVNSWGGSCGGTFSGTGNVDYSTTGVSADCTVQVSFLLAMASQTITFSNPGAQSFGTTPTLTASSSAGGGYPVSFTSATTGVCTITTGGVLTFVTTGSCTINANQAGNASTLAAPQVSQTFTVNAVAPGVPTSVVATAGVASASVAFVAPVTTGGAAITGYIVTSNPGGITGTGASSPITVSGLTNGVAYTFTVTAANLAGPGSASAASNSVTPKASQTITFSNPGAQSFGTTPTLTASSPAGGGYPVSFTSATTGVCTITTGGVLAFITTGSCTINANQAGNASTLAAPQVSQTFAVNAVAPGAPTIGTATAGAGSASVAFTAPASVGGAAITGYTVTSSPGGLTGTGASSPITVSGLTNGTAYTFTVKATNSAGPGSASAASNSVTPKASQTITFSNPGAQSFGTTPTLTASSSAGGGYPVSFTSATTGVCTITTGGVLAFVTTGSCTINANQAGNASTLAAPQVSQTFTVNAVAPGVPTSVVATAGNTQATVSWAAPAGNGDAAIIGYRVQIATTSGGTYSDAAGTCAFATTGTSTAVTCIATGLTNGTQYFFKVAAVSSAGTGSYSTASSGVTPVVPVINGACGTSGNVTTAFLPTANLCSAGTAEPVTAGSSSWAWSCTGSGPSATNANCTAPFPDVNGGGGTVGAILTPGTNGWQIDQALSGFVALPAPAPAGVTFPIGATKVVLITGARGTSV